MACQILHVVNEQQHFRSIEWTALKISRFIMSSPSMPPSLQMPIRHLRLQKPTKHNIGRVTAFSTCRPSGGPPSTIPGSHTNFQNGGLVHTTKLMDINPRRFR
mmetsp:Transcript_19831/g.22838  ORF Transcript_19831/g.22838 Transcript_19831/m.22838 type:complete len:103 (-) Transcript_19831:549-857(-)